MKKTRRISRRRLDKLTTTGKLEQLIPDMSGRIFTDVRWKVSGNRERFIVDPACETPGCEGLISNCEFCLDCQDHHNELASIEAEQQQRDRDLDSSCGP